jgi:hypothetical protein
LLTPRASITADPRSTVAARSAGGEGRALGSFTGLMICSSLLDRSASARAPAGHFTA